MEANATLLTSKFKYQQQDWTVTISVSGQIYIPGSAGISAAYQLGVNHDHVTNPANKRFGLPIKGNCYKDFLCRYGKRSLFKVAVDSLLASGLDLAKIQTNLSTMVCDNGLGHRFRTKDDKIWTLAKNKLFVADEALWLDRQRLLADFKSNLCNERCIITL
jgi:hypothetical protein